MGCMFSYISIYAYVYAYIHRQHINIHAHVHTNQEMNRFQYMKHLSIIYNMFKHIIYTYEPYISYYIYISAIYMIHISPLATSATSDSFFWGKRISMGCHVKKQRRQKEKKFQKTCYVRRKKARQRILYSISRMQACEVGLFVLVGLFCLDTRSLYVSRMQTCEVRRFTGSRPFKSALPVLRFRV